MRPQPRQVLAALAAAVILGAPARAQEAPGIEASVVRIVNYSQHGNWYSPWDLSQVRESSGSGFIIGDGLVMTNAHVVSDSRFLLIQGHNDPEMHVARVVHVAHDSDLALIQPVDGSVLTGPPLELGGLPRLGSTVDTLGYPAGGQQLSSTRGVVSRIEEQLYVHSAKDVHFTVQTDAAINPGSSGGPVLQDGRVVGVAFQANLDLENTGFFIPTEVIGRFLRDVEDGQYDGYPELGVRTSGMENPAARAHAGLAPGESGVRVDEVYPGASAHGHIQEGDILLEVAGQPVASDGSVADGDTRMSFGLLVDRMQIGESLAVRVLRGSEQLEFQIPLVGMTGVDLRGNLYDQLPRYYIYAGLVFVPLHLETLKTYGPEWRAKADKTMLYEFLVRPVMEPERLIQERVVLLRRLTHPVNADMAWFRNEVIERVNDRPITSLEDLVETLEAHQGKYHVFEFSNLSRFSVLDRERAEAAHEEILRRYGIPLDRNL